MIKGSDMKGISTFIGFFKDGISCLPTHESQRWALPVRMILIIWHQRKWNITQTPCNYSKMTKYDSLSNLFLYKCIYNGANRNLLREPVPLKPFNLTFYLSNYRISFYSYYTTFTYLYLSLPIVEKYLTLKSINYF